MCLSDSYTLLGEFDFFRTFSAVKTSQHLFKVIEVEFKAMTRVTIRQICFVKTKSNQRISYLLQNKHVTHLTARIINFVYVPYFVLVYQVGIAIMYFLILSPAFSHWYTPKNTRPYLQ